MLEPATYPILIAGRSYVVTTPEGPRFFTEPGQAIRFKLALETADRGIAALAQQVGRECAAKRRAA